MFACKSFRLRFYSVDVIRLDMMQDLSPFSTMLPQRVFAKHRVDGLFHDDEHIVHVVVILDLGEGAVVDAVAEVMELDKTRTVGFDLLHQMCEKGDVHR